jgi:hypothetical protein
MVLWMTNSDADRTTAGHQGLGRQTNGRRHTGSSQKNGAVSKVDKKFISHLTWIQHTLSAATTVQVSDV